MYRVALVWLCGCCGVAMHETGWHLILDATLPAEDGAPMLECDGCLLGFHLACLEPPLERVPEGDWFCPTCTAQKQWGEGVGPGTAGGGRKSSTSCGSTLRARYLKGGEVDLVRIESIWSEETPDAKPTPPAKAKSKKGGAKGGATSSGAVAGNGAGSEGAAEKEVEYHFLGRWFIRPEETHCGRQPHHGSREVFLTDHLDENEMGTIIRKATVLRAQEYAAAAGGDDDLYLWEYIYRFSWRQFQRRGDDAEEWEDDDDGVIEDMMRRRTGRAADDGGDENYRIDDDEDDDDDIGDRNFHPLSEPAGGAHRGRPRGAYRRAVRARPSLAAIKHVDWDDDGDAGGNHAAATQHPLDRARAALCLSAVPRDLPCRNGAREAIEVFISNALLAAGETEEGKCMYISGVPGTGKTATVREALRRLRQKSHEGLIPPFQSVEVNGLSLQAPRYAYSVIHEALTSERVSPEAALDLLDKRFGGRGGSAASASIKRRGASGYARGGDGASMCVVVIDELDQLMSKNQAVLYNLFQWPGCRNSNLVVIGIANTMDLPERLLPRIASRLGADRLTFLPYTRSELEMILTERLKGVPGAFEPKSLELVSRKVAAVSGDARRALDIARRAAEVAQKRLAEGTGPAGANGMGSVGGAQRQQGSGPQAVGVPTQVTMSDVTTAIQEMCSSPHMQVMKSLSLHGKILLAAVALEEKRCGMSKVLFEQVAGLHAGLCRQNSINPPSTTALHLLVSKLGDCRLLVCEPATRLRLRGIRLNVSSADLPHVLREDGNLKWLEARFSSEPS
eukprot:jgi/Mesvir1/17258/Mv07668-RA.3